MFKLQVITLSGVFKDEEVFEVRVPTTAGTIAINADNAPLVGAIKPGILTVVHKRGEVDSQNQIVGVYSGTVEVLNNVVKVLVDEVDALEDVSQAEAEKALAHAKELSEKAGDSVALAEAHSMIDRSAVRLRLAGLRKHSKH